MPVIPFQTSERSIPGTSGGVYAPSDDPVSAAISRAGAGVAQAGNQFMGVLTAEKRREDAEARALDEKIKNAGRDVHAFEFGHSVEKEANSFYESFKNRNDFENFEADTDKFLTQQQAKLENGEIANDPLLKLMSKKYLIQVSTNLQKIVGVKKAAAITERGKGHLVEEQQDTLQRWVDEPTPEGKQFIADQWALSVQKFEANGVLNQGQAATLIKNFNSHAADAYFLRLENSGELGRALAELSGTDGKSNGSPADYLDPIKRETAITRVVAKIERSGKKEDAQRKADQEEAEQRVMDALDKGDIPGAKSLLYEYGAARKLSPATRRVLDSAINSAGKVEEKSDPDAYHNLEQKILLGKAGQNEILRAKSIVVEDQNKLLRLLKDDKDPRKSYDYTSSLDSARHEIITTGPLAALDQDQQSRFTEYKRAAERNAKAGGDPWQFYDNNIWRYLGRVPASSYGTPKTTEEVSAMQSRLKNDVISGKVSPSKAKEEADRLEKARDWFSKIKVRKNAANPK